MDKDHGRIGIRQCWTLAANQFVHSIRHLEALEQIRSLVLITSERLIGHETSTQARYFISSLLPNGAKLLAAVRSHWGVENGLHWQLDIVFDEDHSRVRKDNAPQYLAVIR